MQESQSLILPTANGGRITVGDRTFLLFVDETGSETLSDPAFPIFGFGGVGLPAKLYQSNIIRPWLRIKASVFGSADISLHAADVRNPTNAQLSALNGFFENCYFCRIAAILSSSAAISHQVDKYNLVVNAFYQRLCHVLSSTDYDDIAMIFEDSQRGNPKNLDYFSRYEMTTGHKSGDPSFVRSSKYLISKSENEPGLEVADFVAHTAGASVQARLKGTRTKQNERRDFKAVFGFKDKRLSSFIEITKAIETSRD